MNLKKELKKLMKDEKGQLSMETLMDGFVNVIVALILLPIIVVFVNVAVVNVDATTAILLGLIPLAWAIGVIRSITSQGKPKFPGQ